MITKSFIILIALLILFALMGGVFFLMKDKGKTNRAVKSLTWRIGLSVGLFLFLFLAYSLNWITPHGL